jgi:3-oxoacyl-[acyl-carrier-protein] synthase-3
VTVLDAVSAFLPPARVRIEEIGAELGLDAKELLMFRRYYGLDEVRLFPDGGLIDLMSAALDKLDALRGREAQVRYVIQARTMEGATPYPDSPLHEICRRAGLTRAASFTLTQHACASGLFAVETAGRLLASDGDPDALALVFVGEKAFTPVLRTIPNTTFMGEGAAAVLVKHDGPKDHLLSYATRTHGQFHAGLLLPPDRAAEFETVYLDALAEVVLAAVAKAGMTLADLDLILPHNVNRLSWMRWCRRTGYPPERVLLDNMPVTGHCFGADAFLNYATATELGRLRSGDRYLMASVGLGATFSAMVFEH